MSGIVATAEITGVAPQTAVWAALTDPVRVKEIHLITRGGGE